jgi:hypothetical protein
MNYNIQPFDWRQTPQSPPMDPHKESIRLVVTEVRYADHLVQLEFHASFRFPDPVAARYKDLGTALVLVLTDVDNHDGFAVRTIDDFIKYEPGAGPPEDNLKAAPPLPLAPRGDPSAASSYTGGYLNGGIAFESKQDPTHRPSVFLYLVLENFFSNVVGLDLVDQRAVMY